MKRANITIKAFLLGALVTAALLFTTCENVFSKPETQIEDGYTRVKINVVGGEVPFDSQLIKRTTFPDRLTDVVYEYYFIKAVNGEYPDVTLEDLLKPNENSEFLLEPGDYKVIVKAYDKTTYDATTPGWDDNDLGAEGSSEEFSVPGVTKVDVYLVPKGTGTGTINIDISYPAGATAAVSLKKWGTTVWGSELLGSTTTNGTYKRTVPDLEAGYYKLVVTINDYPKSAGAIEAIHVYPDLTTTYRKTFYPKDMSSPISIKNVALTIPFTDPELRQGMKRAGTTASTPSVVVADNSPFTVTGVVWKLKSDSGYIDATGDSFVADSIYKVFITLRAAGGYNFAKLTKANATINDNLKPDLLKIDGSTANDPVAEGPEAEYVILSYEFTKVRTVSNITLRPPTFSVTYPHNTKLPLSNLTVRLTYTSGSPSYSADILYKDFEKWNIQVVDAYGDEWVNETVLERSTYNGALIKIICNDAFLDPDLTLTITQKNITSDSKIVITVEPQKYTGADLPSDPDAPDAVDVTVTDDGTLMETGDDYTVSILHLTEAQKGQRTNVGSYRNVVTITGAGNYTGSKSVNFVIEPRDISDPDDITIEFNPAITSTTYKYDGKAKEPTVTVTNTSLGTPPGAGIVLTKDTDYTLTYENNKGVGTTAKVVITGKGNYDNTTKIEKTFTIGQGTINATNAGDYLDATGVWKPAFGWDDIVEDRFTYDGIEKVATVKLKDSMTGIGDLTWKYDGGDDKPKDAGSYPVTISGGGSGTNFTTITDVPIGNLVIDKADLQKEDFAAIAMRVYNGDPQPIIVSDDATNEVKLNTTGVVLKTGLGEVLAVRYGSPASTSIPRDAGTYPITVNMAAGDNFNATGTEGLVIGQLDIRKKTPVLEDFDINGAAKGEGVKVPFDGNPKKVIVEAKTTPAGNQMDGTGRITVRYKNTTTGAEFTTSTDSPNSGPSAQGTYFITFDVAGGTNFEPLPNLGATNDDDNRFKLIIGRGAPAMSDFTVSPTTVTYDGNAKSVTVTPKSGIVGMGVVSNIKYEGSSVKPKNVGKYTITVDVGLGDEYETATNLTVGWLEITKKAPAAGDFTFTVPTSGYTATANGWTVPLTSVGSGVSVALNSTMSEAGTVTKKYKSTEAGASEIDAITAVGTYNIIIYATGGDNFTDANAPGKTGIISGKQLVVTAAP